MNQRVAAPETGLVNGPFHRRTVVVLSVCGVVSFLIAVGVGLFAGEFDPIETPGNNAFSRSALGRHGLVSLLRDLEIPVVVSRFESARKASDDALLVIAEPAPHLLTANYEPLEQTPHLLVVLPKWTGEFDPERPGWVQEVSRIDRDALERTSNPFYSEALIHVPTLSGKARIDTLELVHTPTLFSAQLMAEQDTLEPMLAFKEGVLLGRLTAFDDTDVYVLSDPDMFANHGLDDGHNAAIAVKLLSKLRGGEGAVIFDETLHGFVAQPSIWRVLFEFPLVLLTVQFVFLLVLFLWCGLGRFGAPITQVAGHKPGTGFLVDHIGELLRHGGHVEYALTEFWEFNKRVVLKRSHAPLDLSDSQRRKWFLRLGRSRKIRENYDRLAHHVRSVSTKKRGSGAVASLARRIYNWREEILGGSSPTT